MDNGNNFSPETDPERTLAARCKVVDDIEDLQMLYDLNADQALEVLRISELRCHREAMDLIQQRLDLMFGPLQKVADKMDEFIDHQYEGGRRYGL